MTGLFQLTLTGDRNTAECAERALEAGSPSPIAISRFDNGGVWTLEVLYGEPPGREDIGKLLAGALGRVPPFDLALLPERDWVAESLKGLKPVHAGRFLIHGSHDREIAVREPLAIEIEAGAAFGTGHHATTLGCLIALGDLARTARRPRVLDIGTGTGVLAIAAAKLWKQPLMASDIDPVAVAVARDNARLNDVATLLTAVCAGTLDDPRIQHRAPYDVVIANILAGPLISLAAPVARISSHCSKIVLSGLLQEQSRAVLAVWRTHGFVRRRHYLIDGWETLVLARAGCRHG